MTLEEVKKFLKDDAEGKAYLQSLLDESVSGLKTKNTELLDKLKKEKDALREAEGKLEELEDTVAKGKPDFEREKQKLEAKFNKETKELREQLEAANGHVNKLVIENGLSEALTKANISPVHQKAVAALLKTSSKIELDITGDTPTAKVGDKGLADYVKSWAESEEGKHYVAAPANSGGGAKGTTATGGKGPDISGLSPQDRLTYARANPGK